MVRLAWLTDVHLDFLDGEAIDRLARDIAAEAPDGVVLSGDITVASFVARDIGRLSLGLGRPLWFVLGNHDYYGADIDIVRQVAGALTRTGRGVDWLPSAGVVALSDRTALVGVDGWGDGRLGNPETTPVMLNDFVHIGDLRGLPRRALIGKLRTLGDEEAARGRELLVAALSEHEHVVFVTHVPPFREACWHEGAISNDDWLPWFTCKAMGDMLLEVADAHPRRSITVLCGHVHSRGTARMRDNLVVLTGAAEYGAPAVERILELD